MPSSSVSKNKGEPGEADLRSQCIFPGGNVVKTGKHIRHHNAQFLSICLLPMVLFLSGKAFSQATLSDSLHVITGAERMNEYLPVLKGKKIALVVNHTSVVGRTLLPDTLLSLYCDIKKIFSPEHGFRGIADAGEAVTGDVDPKTGITIVSLYGKEYKPTPDQLKGIDLVVYDLQDVGVRFYTYISTLHYMMEACAENNVELLVLDRPNPNGFYVDGPVLDSAF
ncbi:MAG: exo-beta-N-acetylmuramidase NamZ domain-containing protein, partial [Chitinophagales bacterium]